MHDSEAKTRHLQELSENSRNPVKARRENEAFPKTARNTQPTLKARRENEAFFENVPDSGSLTLKARRENEASVISDCDPIRNL